MKPLLSSLRSANSRRNDETSAAPEEDPQITVAFAEGGEANVVVELTLDMLLSSAFQMSELPMALVAPHGELLVSNPALCSLLGYPSRLLCDLVLSEIAHEDDASRIDAALENVRDGQQNFSLQAGLYNRSGELIEVQIFGSSARERGESTRFLLIQMHEVPISRDGNQKATEDNEVTLLQTRIQYLESEIAKTEHHNQILTEQLIAQAEAKSESGGTYVIDPLTGAYSQMQLEKMLESEVSRCNRSNGKFSLIVCDMDYFSRIKAGCGEKNADKVLVVASQIFEARLRRADILFRIGEDEFAMLLPNTSILGAGVVANSLRKRLGDTLIDEVGLCSASFGVVEWTGHENGKFVLERALATVQAAKNEGRNRVVISEDIQS